MEPKYIHAHIHIMCHTHRHRNRQTDRHTHRASVPLDCEGGEEAVDETLEGDAPCNACRCCKRRRLI